MYGRFLAFFLLVLFLCGCTSKGDGISLWLVETLPGAFEDTQYSADLVQRKDPAGASVHAVPASPESPPPTAEIGLPPGMTLSDDGVIQGAPQKTGLFCFGVEVHLVTAPRQYTGSTVRRKTYLLHVFGVTLKDRLAAAVRDLAYDLPVYSHVHPAAADFTWSVEQPSQVGQGVQAGLPPGLSLTNGVLTGTPTGSGVYAFVVVATSGAYEVRKEYTFVVRTFEWARGVIGATGVCESPRCCATADGATHAVWLRDDAGVKRLVYAANPEAADAAVQDPMTAAASDDVVAADVTAGEDGSSQDAGVVAWLDSSDYLKVAYSTDTSTVAHQKDIGTSDADVRVLYQSGTLKVIYAARGGGDGIFLWRPVSGQTETVASGTFYGLAACVVAGLQEPVLAARDAQDAYVFWYDATQSTWRNATCPRGSGDTDARDDVALSEGPDGGVRLFWSRGGHVEAALFDPSDGTFGGIVSVCDGLWIEAIESTLVAGNAWLLIGADDGTGTTIARWATFDGLDGVLKDVADYTPPIQSKDIDSGAVCLTTGEDGLVVLCVEGEIRWTSWTPHAWSYPETIASRAAFAYNLQVAKTASGDAYAVWRETTDWNTPGPIYFSKNEGSGWSTPSGIGAGFTAARVISMAADDTDLLHMVFYQSDGDDGEVFYSCYQSGAWTAPYNLSGSSGVESRWPRLCVEGTSVYVVWFEGVSAGNSVKLVTGPVWQTVEDVRQQSGRILWNPRIDTEAGRVAVVWTERLDPSDSQTDRVFVRGKIGGNWTSAEMVSEGSNRENYPSCALMSGSVVGVIWQRNETSSTTLMFRLYDFASQGLGTIESVASGAGAGAYPSLCYAYDGFFAVWKHPWGGSGDLLTCRRRTDTGWGKPYVVSRKVVSNRWNRIVSTPGGLISCWIEENAGQYELVFSEWK